MHGVDVGICRAEPMHTQDPVSKQIEVTGEFFERDGERWYRIDAYDAMPAFFLALTSDSDIWAFISTNGSLAAGRRDSEQSFLPYETVDKIHARWETTGPRTWIRYGAGTGQQLWEPFSRRPGWISGQRLQLSSQKRGLARDAPG